MQPSLVKPYYSVVEFWYQVSIFFLWDLYHKTYRVRFQKQSGDALWADTVNMQQEKLLCSKDKYEMEAAKTSITFHLVTDCNLLKTSDAWSPQRIRPVFIFSAVWLIKVPKTPITYEPRFVEAVASAEVVSHPSSPFYDRESFTWQKRWQRQQVKLLH